MTNRNQLTPDALEAACRIIGAQNSFRGNAITHVLTGKPQPISWSVAAGAVLVMFLWAICFPLISLGLANAPPLAFATLRALIAGGTLLLLAEGLRRPGIAGANHWGGIVLVGFTATSIGFVGMFQGGGLISPGLATVLTNTQPLIAAVLAWLFLDEHLRPIQRFGLAAGFLGIVFIGTPGLSRGTSQALGLAFILFGAVGIAVSNVALKRLAGRVDPLRAMGWQLVIGSLPLLVLSWQIEDFSSIEWSISFVLNLLVLSVIGTSAAFALWFSLMRKASLSQLNVFSFLTPIFGLLMGAAFFTERFGGIELVGVMLSLLGIYWVSRTAPAKAAS